MSARCRRLIDTDASRKAKFSLTKIFARDFCNKPAVWRTFLGQDLCEEHAEAWVKAMQDPNTLINVLADKSGMTEEEARKRMTRIQ